MDNAFYAGKAEHYGFKGPCRDNIECCYSWMKGKNNGPWENDNAFG